MASCFASPAGLAYQEPEDSGLSRWFCGLSMTRLGIRVFDFFGGKFSWGKPTVNNSEDLEVDWAWHHAEGNSVSAASLSGLTLRSARKPLVGFSVVEFLFHGAVAPANP